jgi:hypothetical protein
METLPRKWVRDVVTMTNLLSDGQVKQYRRYTYADVVKLVYTLVLGTSVARREGSSPFIRTNEGE